LRSHCRGVADIDQFKTVFPPLLIGLEQHQAFLRDVVRAVDRHGDPATLKRRPGLWQASPAEPPEEIRDPELRGYWNELVRVGTECATAAKAAIAAANSDRPAETQLQLDRLFNASAAWYMF